MKKYRCLTDDYFSFDEGEVYGENEISAAGNCTVYHFVEKNPERWELVEDDTAKKIVGYKLKPECEKYRSACKKILKAYTTEPSDYFNQGFAMISTRPAKIKTVEYLTDAGVLDLWFEPVYMPKHSLPKIDCYEGRIDGYHIIYGCKKVHITFIQDLLDLEVSHVNFRGITIEREALQQILDCFNDQ